MTNVEALRKERDTLEEHIDPRWGCCQWHDTVGDCVKCLRYYDLTDQIVALEVAQAR